MLGQDGLIGDVSYIIFMTEVKWSCLQSDLI